MQIYLTPPSDVSYSEARLELCAARRASAGLALADSVIALVSKISLLQLNQVQEA